MYYTNMKSLLAEMIRKSEMIIFNRCDGIQDLNVYKRNIKAVNPAADVIFEDRMRSWNLYKELLTPLAEEEKVELPHIPEGCTHNAHMFYVKAKNLEERTKLIDYLKENGVQAVFHYIPLHTAPAGQRFGRFHGEDVYTTKESERLMRLPMYYGLKEEEVRYVASKIIEFYSR